MIALFIFCSLCLAGIIGASGAAVKERIAIHRRVEASIAAMADRARNVELGPHLKDAFDELDEIDEENGISPRTLRLRSSDSIAELEDPTRVMKDDDWAETARSKREMADILGCHYVPLRLPEDDGTAEILAKFHDSLVGPAQQLHVLGTAKVEEVADRAVDKGAKILRTRSRGPL